MNVNRYLISSAIACACLASPALAKDRTYRVDLPAQSMSRSLLQAAEITGFQVVFSDSRINRMAARPLAGSFTPNQIFGKLLRSSGYDYAVSGNVVRVFAASPSVTKISATTVAAPALAQAVAQTVSREPDAMEGAGDGGDIIVTARRVEERLQDVPISMTVFSQDDLTQRNVAVASDLAVYTPALSVNQRFGPEKTQFALRGFNQSTNGAPTVGVYFAEVVGVRAQGGTIGGNTVGAGSFTDLANVQVLKGPQGTLFGRNTTGGAVLLTPQKPTGDFGGYVEGTLGNYDQLRLAGALNIPLADTFKVRLAVERNKRDGYMRNAAGIGAKAFNDINYVYGRLSVVADLTDDLENYMIVHYSDSDTNGYASRIVGCASFDANQAPLVRPGQPGYNSTRYLGALACQVQLARQTARGDGPYDVESRLANPYIKIQQWQVINTTTWQASEDITLKNILSYGEYRERTNFSLGANNFVVPNFNGTGGLDITAAQLGPIIPAGTVFDRNVITGAGDSSYNGAESTVTEELQLQGETMGGKLKFVIGGYLEFSRPLSFSSGLSDNFINCTDIQSFQCSNVLGTGTISNSSTELGFDNHGVFGQGTYNFTDRLSFTAGGRWTFDKIVGVGQNTRVNVSTAPGSYVDPRTGVSIQRFCSDTVRHPNKMVTSKIDCTTNLVNKSNEPTWLVGLDFKPTPDLLVYGKYSRGYRQGGMVFTSPGFETWGPEKMDTYEIGGKATFRGAVSGYFNLAGFYNNLSDLQVFAQLTPTPEARLTGVTGGSAVINAGKARSYGLEADASLLFFDSLRLSAGYAYISTKIVDVDTPGELLPKLVGTPFQSVTPQVTKGTGFADTPKHRLTVSGEYTLPLDESIGEISVGATWVYTSRMTTNFSEPQYVNSEPIGITPGSNLINLNLDWKSVAGAPIDLAFFATNVTKEVTKIPNQSPFTNTGIGEVGYAPPRMYGVRVRYNFGQ